MHAASIDSPAEHVVPNTGPAMVALKPPSGGASVAHPPRSKTASPSADVGKVLGANLAGPPLTTSRLNASRVEGEFYNRFCFLKSRNSNEPFRLLRVGSATFSGTIRKPPHALRGKCSDHRVPQDSQHLFEHLQCRPAWTALDLFARPACGLHLFPTHVHAYYGRIGKLQVPAPGRPQPRVDVDHRFSFISSTFTTFFQGN